MQNYFSSKKSGFTLIEIIVSLALFSVVITIAVGALLILITSNRQLQNEQSVLSNLSFALDSMTREIRTGSNYYCANGQNVNDGVPGQYLFTSNPSLLSLADTGPNVVGDCASGNVGNATFPDGFPFHGIAFNEGGDSITDGTGSIRIAYFHDRATGKLYRRLSDELPESIVSDGIYISDVDFFVTGSDRTTASDDIQPKITILIEAYNSAADAAADTVGDRAYLIQTTVTQRTLDI